MVHTTMMFGREIGGMVVLSLFSASCCFPRQGTLPHIFISVHLVYKCCTSNPSGNPRVTQQWIRILFRGGENECSLLLYAMETGSKHWLISILWIFGHKTLPLTMNHGTRIRKSQGWRIIPYIPHHDQENLWKVGWRKS